MAIGRNELCPCGSGKKYKKCCLGRQQSFAGSAATDNNFEEIQELLAGSDFSSLDEAQAAMDELFTNKNALSLDDFHGLSASQMHSFIHQPFDSPDLVKFSESLPPGSSVPFIDLLSLLVEAIGDKGLKATAIGNLPPKFCKAAALSCRAKEEYKGETTFRSIRTEQDFYDLHCLRLLLELCGIVRKFKGKFIIGTKYRKTLADQGPLSLYPLLFKSYITGFNWGYGDNYEDVYFIQQSVFFSLYLLSKYGDIERPQTFYQDQYIKAFPAVLSEVKDSSYNSAEEELRSMYFIRTFRRFCIYFGLAEVKQEKPGTILSPYTVKKLPLLDHVVTFCI